ncbi:hypothetical protein LA080_012219 [Diaporthe eres]|nr:hypothetical protein LA080_012219 [Diaporthe eres]
MGWEKPIIITLLVYYPNADDAEQGTKPVGSILCAQTPRSFGPPDSAAHLPRLRAGPSPFGSLKKAPADEGWKQGFETGRTAGGGEA